MSEDTIKVNMNVYDIPILVEQLKKLEKENKQLKERFERLKQEHIDTITRNEEKQQRIDKAIDYIKDKLSSLNMNKSAIMRIVEPSNGYLLADVNYEIQKWERLLEILGDKE